MSTEVDKFRALVDSLLRRTRAKTLEWSIGGQWQTSPTCELASYSITLSNGENSEGEPIEIITIQDGYGSDIDSFNDSELSKAGDVNSYWMRMKELRKLAYRQGKGADKALESILRSLDDEVDF